MQLLHHAKHAARSFTVVPECVNCDSPLVGRSIRCEPCRTAHNREKKRRAQREYARTYPERAKASRRAFANSEKGRALRRKHDRLFKANRTAEQREKQNGYNRAYRLRHFGRASSTREYKTGPICIACKAAPVVGKSPRCQPCRKERSAERQRAFFSSEKGAQAKERMRVYNRAYYQREDVKAKRRVKVRKRAAHIPGTRRYAHSFAAHVCAWRAALRRRDRLRKAAVASECRSSRPVAWTTGNSADLELINALVPRIEGREDICQDLALALLDGTVTRDTIAAHVRKALRKFHRDNFEGNGYAVSLSEPRRDGRPWDDVLAESVNLWAR